MKYNTRQREALIAYLISLAGAHVTAEQIEQHFVEKNEPISRTTIYRHLNQLVAEGLLRHYNTDRSTPDCYQYVAEHEHCEEHFHMLCDVCGKLVHMDCSELSAIKKHIAAEHDFNLNAAATVFRGVCGACLKQQ